MGQKGSSTTVSNNEEQEVAAMERAVTEAEKALDGCKGKIRENSDKRKAAVKELKALEVSRSSSGGGSPKEVFFVSMAMTTP